MTEAERNARAAVGKRISELRKAKGWTQEDLAKAAVLLPDIIIDIEAGELSISLQTLERILKALGVRIEDIVT